MTLTYKAQVVFNLPTTITEITNSVEGIGYTSSGTVTGFTNSTITRNSTSTVEIAKSASASTVVPNQSFTYFLTISNGESEEVTVSNITDQLPSAFTVTSLKMKVGTATETTLVSSDYTLSPSKELVVTKVNGSSITVPANGTTVLSITGYLS